MSPDLDIRRSSLVRQRGATLIELMIALLLGLVVVAAASGLFLTNKRVYASTETLNRIQENSRASFEIMSRDIREAGAKPCGASSQLVSQLKSGDSAWWTQYANGMQGYEAGAGPGLADALDIHLTGTTGGTIAVTEHNNPSAILDVTHSSGIDKGDALMVCNNEFSMIFEVTNVPGSGDKIQHNSGNTAFDGNECSHFSFARPCSSGAGGSTGYCFAVPPATAPHSACDRFSRNPAQVVKVQSLRWYVDNNGRGGRSLYRARMGTPVAGSTPAAAETVEVAEGISDLQLEYRSPVSGGWQSASGIADWSVVNAVKVTFTAEGTEGAVQGRYLEGTDGAVLSRNTTHIVAIRNREGVL